MNNNEYPAITVDQLFELCREQINQGNGNKKILISSDDEGNGYHGLFYQFMSDQEEIDSCKEMGMFHDNVDTSDIILLG